MVFPYRTSTAHQKLPDATPRSGELGLEVIQIGYLRGLLQSGSDRIPYLDHSWLNDPDLSHSLTLRAVEEIRERLRPLRQSRERIQYIEDFITEVEAHRERNSQVQKLYEAVYILEEKASLPHSFGIGLVAVHFYHHSQ